MTAHTKPGDEWLKRCTLGFVTRVIIADDHGIVREGLRRLDAGEPGPTSMSITLGAVRWGDAAAFLSPGENFCEQIDGNGNPRTTDFAWSTVCPLAALELMWQMQWDEQKPRCYGKWLDSGRYGNSTF